MSPSKRAGDTVDESVDDERSSATGPPSGDRRDETGGPRAKPRRRSVLSSGTTAPPERGSSSQRGSSSSTITKRGSFAEDDDGDTDADDVTVADGGSPDVHAATLDEGTGAEASGAAPAGGVDVAEHDDVDNDEVAVASAPVAAPPPPPPTPSVDAAARPLRTDPAPVTDLPLPIAAPDAAPAARTSTILSEPEHPIVPPNPPYEASTMSAHAVAPVPRIVGRRPRVRRVTRVVRHVDPWSVFKVSIVFNLVLYGVLLTAGVLLWNVAYATGTVDNLERFFESFGWSDFEFDGGAIYHASWIAGLFGVVGLTGATVLAATLFNLITDLVGGIRMTVLEEEVQERTQAPMRRFVVRRPSSGADPSAGLRREVDRYEGFPARDDPLGPPTP